MCPRLTVSPGDLQLVVLRDNMLSQAKGLPTAQLRAGHGFALLVRTRVGAFMLDAGDSVETWENADALGIDLAEITALVLSHGHYDHTNGLPELLERLGGLMIVAHPAVFETRLAARPEASLLIGPPASREELESMGAILQLSADPVTVAPGVTTTGEVRRISDLAPVTPSLQVERDGKVIEDDFVDDLSVLAGLDDGDVLLTGCAHAGLVNIVARCEEIAGRCPTAVAGGTHLREESEERIGRVADELARRGVRQIIPMHCSGERGADLLEKHFDGEVLRAGVGDTIVADRTGRISVR